MLASSGRKVENLGVGGENSATIAARFGPQPLRATVAGGAIPASGPVVVTLDSVNGAVSPLLQADGGINPARITGVEGVLSLGDGEYRFNRSAAGAVVAAAGATPIETFAARNYRDRLPVIWMGQNDGTNDATAIIARAQAIIDWVYDDRWIVIGLSTGDAAGRAAMEAQFAAAFGSRFLNIRAYLSSDRAMADAGLEPTADDLADMSAGRVPPRFRSDAVHLNSVGYSLVALAVYRVLLDIAARGAPGPEGKVGDVTPAAVAARDTAVAAAAFVQSVARSVYPFEAADVEVALDTAGVPRLIAFTQAGVSQRYQDNPAYQPPGVTSAITFAGGRTYPDLARVTLDTAGVPRLVEVVGPEVTGPNIFGAASSSADAPSVPIAFDLFLVAGQSNADGRGTGGALPATGVGYQWSSADGAVVAMTNPVGNTAESKGSMWTAFAAEYFRRTGRGVIICSAAIGSSTLIAASAVGGGANHWGAGGSNRAVATARFANCVAWLDAQGWAYQFAGILWSLGETDGGAIDAGTVTAQQVKDGFEPLLTFLRAGTSPKAPFVIVRTGRRGDGDTTGWRAVRDMQRDWCRSFDGVHIGYTGTVTYPARNLMGDNLHYSQAGLDEAGFMTAIVAASVCAGRA